MKRITPTIIITEYGDSGMVYDRLHLYKRIARATCYISTRFRQVKDTDATIHTN